MSLGMTFGDVLNTIRNDGLENVLSRFYSLYPGRITDNADDAQVGRTKVKVHGLGMQKEHPQKAWPVSQFAGRNYGSYFPPHVDDEVLVSFDHGSINSPVIVGAYWPNQDDAHKPETSHVPAEFVIADGGEPTKRGIKSRGGSVLIFDDAPETYHFEVYTGAAETEEVSGRTRPRVGIPAKKHHSVRLDDKNENIVISTFGELPAGREDTDENRVKHVIIMQDKAANRFVSIATIGEVSGDDERYHQFLLSDTEKKIRAESTQEHYWEINDADQKITCSTKNLHRWEIDQKNKKITTSTAAGYGCVHDETAQQNLLATPNNQSISQGTAGTEITDLQGDVTLTSVAGVNVSAVGASTHSYRSGLTVAVNGSWTTQVLAAAQLLVTGNLTISGLAVSIIGPAAVNIQSANVILGAGAATTLLKATAAAKYNAHVHTAAGVPPMPLMETADLTISTKAS
jgi:hypothetical protein